ncbi:Probable tRNA pseudouridine synthase 1 [Apodemus speciosus]|uniref:Probable tRNA pseudouridine synthase 1 n=1 Tax=Apodemus speciosus TaxID=105296 RepID=A0ABQ0FTK9_APOSI
MAAAEIEVVSPLIPDTSPDTLGSSAASVATEVAAAARTGSQAQVSKAALAAKLMSLSGVFAVHKPKGPTSAELLNRLKEKLLAEAGMPSPERNKRQKQTLKVGHGGTLDSAAQGVLDGWDWKRNKNVDQYVVGVQETQNHTNQNSCLTCTPMAVAVNDAGAYITIGELGKATDTLDSTGKVTEEKPYDKITQEDIEDVECGGGFYIRSLVSDIGKELSSCARVLELTRTKQGPFTLAQHALPEDRWTIDDIARSLEPCALSLLPEELTFKKSRSEDSSDQVLSCGYITLRETEREDDAAKTL